MRPSVVLVERSVAWYRFLNLGTHRSEARPDVRVAQRFELLLEKFRLPDGSRWNGQQLQDATGGVVTRSYVSMMRKGRIENPGFDKLRAIAKAMNFPPELWFAEADRVRSATRVEQPKRKRAISDRLKHLFEAIKNERTGEPYTSAEVARMTLGDLTEEDVEGIRTGALENPTMRQVVALAEAFGVHPSYFLDTGSEPALLGEQELDALGDKRARAILNESMGLSEREKDMVLDMIQHLGKLHDSR
jgi:transcriptional regulator with XRE-family HTH domain